MENAPFRSRPLRATSCSLLSLCMPQRIHLLHDRRSELSLHSDYAEMMSDERVIGRNRETCHKLSLEPESEKGRHKKRSVDSPKDGFQTNPRWFLPEHLDLSDSSRILFLYASGHDGEFTDKNPPTMFRFDSACYRLICRIWSSQYVEEHGILGR